MLCVIKLSDVILIVVASIQSFAAPEAHPIKYFL
jgi:hypothetical protein